MSHGVLLDDYADAVYEDVSWPEKEEKKQRRLGGGKVWGGEGRSPPAHDESIATAAAAGVMDFGTNPLLRSWTFSGGFEL